MEPHPPDTPPPWEPPIASDDDPWAPTWSGSLEPPLEDPPFEDPPGETVLEPSPPELRQWRRWPWIVAVSVLSIGMVAGGAFSFRINERGREWKGRALAAESENLDLNAQLTTSEEHVAGLEGRVEGLASEKAALEGEREIVEGERDAARGEHAAAQAERAIAAALAILAADAADKSQFCLADLDTLLNGVLDAFTYNQSVSYLIPTANDARAHCAAADESYLEFTRTIEGP